MKILQVSRDKRATPALRYLPIDQGRLMRLETNFTVQGGILPDTRQNVSGETVDNKYPDQVIIVCGHYDCIWGNVGEDDNGNVQRLPWRPKPAVEISTSCKRGAEIYTIITGRLGIFIIRLPDHKNRWGT